MNKLEFKTTNDVDSGAFFVSILIDGKEVGSRVFGTLEQSQFYIQTISDALKIVDLLNK